MTFDEIANMERSLTRVVQRLSPILDPTTAQDLAAVVAAIGEIRHFTFCTAQIELAAQQCALAQGLSLADARAKESKVYARRLTSYFWHNDEVSK